MNEQQYTIKKQKKSIQKQSVLKIRKNAGVVEHDLLKEFLNEEFIHAAIMECLKNNDPEGAMEILQIYINALHKAKKELFTEAQVPKTTAYHSLRSKNPTLKTFSKRLYAM